MTQLATVLYRYRWGLVLVGAAVTGIVLIEVAPGIAGEYESAVVNVIGAVLVVGLATLVFFALRDLRAATKQSR